VVGALDDHFVRADAVHLVEDALARLVQISLDLESGELVRHGSKTPTRFVGLAAVPVREDFVRCCPLVARAERAEPRSLLVALVLKFAWPLAPL
jgi:hypothetical protein